MSDEINVNQEPWGPFWGDDPKIREFDGITKNGVRATFEDTEAGGRGRGIIFRAPIDMTITGVRVPVIDNEGPQIIQTMLCDGFPSDWSSHSSNFETLDYFVDEGIDYIPVNYELKTGDILAILGVRGRVNYYSGSNNTQVYDLNDDTMSEIINLTIERMGSEQNFITDGPVTEIYRNGTGNNGLNVVEFKYTTGAEMVRGENEGPYNIAMITDTLTHSAAINTEKMLMALDHNVTVFRDAQITNDNMLLSFDLIVMPRSSADQSIRLMRPIKAALNNGVAVIFGNSASSGGTGAFYNNYIEHRLVLTDESFAGSSSYRTIDIVNDNHFVTSGLPGGISGEVVFTPQNDFLSFITNYNPNAEIIATAAASGTNREGDNNLPVIAIWDTLQTSSLIGDTFTTRMAYCGFLYGRMGYTRTAMALIEGLIRWVKQNRRSSGGGGDTGNNYPFEVLEPRFAASKNTITLRWLRPTDTDFEGVIIYRNGQEIARTNLLEFNDGEFGAATTVNYTVKARNIYGDVSDGVEVVAITSDGIPKTAPQNLRVTDRGEAKIKLAWDPVENATIYEVYNAANNLLLYQGVQPEFTHTSLIPLTTYHYQVKGVSIYGSSEAATISGTTLASVYGNTSIYFGPIGLRVKHGTYKPWHVTDNGLQEIKMIPSPDKQRDAAAYQQGSRSRRRIKLDGWVTRYEDYLQLYNAFIEGRREYFEDRELKIKTYTVISDLGEPNFIRANIINYSIEFMES